jgi:hypothetical protein
MLIGTYRKNNNKNLKKLIFCWHLKATAKKSRIRIRIHNAGYRSKDPDPYKNGTDPEYL